MRQSGKKWSGMRSKFYQRMLDASGHNDNRGSMTRGGITLSELRPGECGHIGHIKGSTPSRLRLMELGLTPGIHVQMIRIAAFGGPLDVEVRGYQLSLRREEADLVWLSPIE